MRGRVGVPGSRTKTLLTGTHLLKHVSVEQKEKMFSECVTIENETRFGSSRFLWNKIAFLSCRGRKPEYADKVERQNKRALFAGRPYNRR